MESGSNSEKHHTSSWFGSCVFAAKLVGFHFPTTQFGGICSKWSGCRWCLVFHELPGATLGVQERSFWIFEVGNYHRTRGQDSFQEIGVAWQQMSSEMGECRVIRQDCKWMCLKCAEDKNLETPRLCRFPSFFFEMKWSKWTTKRTCQILWHFCGLETSFLLDSLVRLEASLETGGHGQQPAHHGVGHDLHPYFPPYLVGILWNTAFLLG